jgi:hypothetical protein
VVDLPDHLAKVLAELESRKESLRNRLESLDSAINGIHALQSASPGYTSDAIAAEAASVREAESLLDVIRHNVPERENAREIQRTAEPKVENEPAAHERRDFILRPDIPNSPAERPKQPGRPLPSPAPDKRQRAHLNVYVNKNADWASRQFVPPHSSRAIFRQKAGQACPKCGSHDTRLSLTRGIADCFMFLFDYSLARCRNCDTRFRVWRAREDEDDDQSELEAHNSAK